MERPLAPGEGRAGKGGKKVHTKEEENGTASHAPRDGALIVTAAKEKKADPPCFRTRGRGRGICHRRTPSRSPHRKASSPPKIPPALLYPSPTCRENVRSPLLAFFATPVRQTARGKEKRKESKVRKKERKKKKKKKKKEEGRIPSHDLPASHLRYQSYQSTDHTYLHLELPDERNRQPLEHSAVVVMVSKKITNEFPHRADKPKAKRLKKKKKKKNINNKLFFKKKIDEISGRLSCPQTNGGLKH